MRFWGFRQQISKAKYLKISQNVDRKYLEASGEHRGTVQKNILKCRSVSGWVLSEDPDMSDRGSWNALLSHPALGTGCKIFGWNDDGAEFRMWDIRVEWRRSRILDVRHPDGMAAEQSSGCETSRWNVSGAEFRMWYIRVEWRRAPLSGLPQGEAHGTHDHHTPDDSISYPDMFSGWKRPTFRRPQMVCPDALSGHLLQGRLKRNSISDCFGDQKAIKTPKLNTIWLELIARVLNMLIGLKGNNSTTQKCLKELITSYEIALFK